MEEAAPAQQPPKCENCEKLGTATPADYFHYDGDGLLVRSTTRTNRDWYYQYDGRANP